MSAQLAMTFEHCKERGCQRAVVGSSVTGEGKVCKRHNELEWARRLSHSAFPDWRRFAQRWLTELSA